MITIRKKIVATIAALTLGISLLVLGSTATAEIDTKGEKTWGVYGLATGTQTDSIKSQVMAIEQIGNRVYVGGKFLETRRNKYATGIEQPFLAAFDATTGDFIDTFRPELDGAVYALQAAPDQSALYIGGEFDSINGDFQAATLSALDPITGDVNTSRQIQASNTSGAQAVIHEITLSGQDLFIAGRFTHLKDATGTKHETTGAGKISLATSRVDTSFSANATGGSVWGIAVAPDGSKVYLAGFHTATDGDTDQAYYSVLDAAGTAIPSLNKYVPNSSRGYGQDIVAVGDLVFWGGSEHIINVYNANTGDLVTQHSTDRGGDFQDIEVVGDRVYASCHCYTNHWADFNYWAADKPSVGEAPAGTKITPIKLVAAYSAIDGSHIDSFTLDVSAVRSGVWAIHGAPDGCLWVGGDLNRVTDRRTGSNRSLGGFTKFCEDFSGPGGDTAAPSTPGNLQQTYQSKTKIVLRWDASTDNDAVDSYEISRDGAVIGTKPAGSSSLLWYTDADLSPGTYQYSVTALDLSGNRSVAATTEASTKNATLQAPTISTTKQTRDRIVLKWSKVEGASQYIVQRDSAQGFQTVGTKTSISSNIWYTDRTLTKGTAYTYRVVATNGDAIQSAPSNILTVSTLP